MTRERKHIVILSAGRVGSHMLRSMLRADLNIVDLGCLNVIGENLVPAPNMTVLDQFYETYVKRCAPLTCMSNLKFGAGIEKARRTGAVFIYLWRRNMLAQAASTALAQQYNCFYSEAPPGASIALIRSKVEDLVQGWRGLHNDFRQRLLYLPHIELVYEDLSVPIVRDKVSSLLGRNVVVGEPTTPKSSPPLEECVTNLREFNQDELVLS